MFDNIFGETLYIEKLYGEYISFVNRYQNFNRQSAFCRYLNINKSASTYNTETNSTFDRYNSGIQYDIYDYTPLFYSSQVINDASDATDLKGQMFQGSLNVITYSIEKPRIEDIIIFNRPPQQGVEIFRVDHIRASINAMNSNPNANWFELTLEYAPIIDLSKLNSLNHYVYSLSMQKNIFSSEFKRMILETEKMNDLFKYLINNNFDKSKELFYFEQDGQKIVPLYENYIIYDFLAHKPEYQNHFDNILRPYGILNFSNSSGFLSLDTLEPINITYPDNLIFSPDILEQNVPVNLFQMVHLIQLWIWERDKNSYPFYKPPDNSVYVTKDNIVPYNLNSSNVKCDPKVGLKIDISKLPFNLYKEI